MPSTRPAAVIEMLWSPYAAHLGKLSSGRLSVANWPVMLRNGFSMKQMRVCEPISDALHTRGMFSNLAPSGSLRIVRISAAGNWNGHQREVAKSGERRAGKE